MDAPVCGEGLHVVDFAAAAGAEIYPIFSSIMTFSSSFPSVPNVPSPLATASMPTEENSLSRLGVVPQDENANFLKFQEMRA